MVQTVLSAARHTLVKTEVSTAQDVLLLVFVTERIASDVLSLVPAAGTASAAKAATIELNLVSQSQQIRFTAARFGTSTAAGSPGGGGGGQLALSELADCIRGERRSSRRGGAGPAIVGLLSVDAAIQLPVQT